MDTAKSVNEGVWVVEKSMALSSLNIGENGSLEAPEGKSLTMTVDGIGMPIKPGSYKGDIFINVLDSLFIQPGGLMRMGNPREYRTGILIEDGRYVTEKSAQSIIQSGTVTDKGMSNVTIQGREDNFNGIIIKGDTEYTIDKVQIGFEGNGNNDFIGFGAGIMCIDDAKVTVNDSEVNLKSIRTCAIHVGGNSIATFNNCRISNESPATDKTNPTWVLGFRGSSRATQLCDFGTVYYNNCYLLSNGWGTLSVDGGIRVRMFVKDSTVELKGPRAHGYGAFTIGDCLVSYDHCIVNVQGYALLVGGHGNQQNAEITNGSVLNSTRYGVMIFRDSGSDLKVNKGSIINSVSSTFLVKGANTNIYIDDAFLNPDNGVVLQLMDSDEPGMGAARFIIPEGEVDEPIPGRDLTVADPKEDVFMTVSNMAVFGDFYNSTTNLKANCRELDAHGETADMPGMFGLIDMTGLQGPGGGGGGGFDMETLQGVKNLDLKFINTKVKGIISAATASYKDGLKIIDVRNNKELSNVTQTAHDPVNNGVIVSFDKDCTWIVSGTSYLTSLTVAEGTVIQAPEGKTLTMKVDGENKEIAPGTYTGKIVLTVA